MLHIRASLCHISCFGHGLSSRQAVLSVYVPFGYAQGTTQPPPAYFSARLLCRSGFGRFCFLVAINQSNKKRPRVISVSYIKENNFLHLPHLHSLYPPSSYFLVLLYCTPSLRSQVARPTTFANRFVPLRFTTLFATVPQRWLKAVLPFFLSVGNLSKAVLFFCFFYLKIKNE